MGKISKSEIQWVSYRDKDGNERFVTTSNAVRDTYYIYEVNGTDATKLGSAKSPAILEERFSVLETCGFTKKPAGR